MVTDALGFIDSDQTSHDKKRQKDERKVIGKVVQSLSKKRGQALRATLYAVLNHVWIRMDQTVLPPEATQKLVGQLISIFDELPVEKQAWLLEIRWDEIKSPALLPLLKKYAQRDENDFLKVPGQDSYEARKLTALALRRWYELDPAGARPAIIQKIRQPASGIAGFALKILPDKTLPEVDHALADHLTSGTNLNDPTASLIARYATAAISPQVLKKIDRNTDECGPSRDLLAYILRVDPAAAKPRIEKTIALCAKNGSQRTRRTLTDVAAIYYDPVLEEIAIRNLDNADPQTAADAATMLGKSGSAAAEPALWRRFEKWSKR